MWSDDDVQVQTIKVMLDNQFNSIKDLGEIKYSLRFEIMLDQSGIFLGQRIFIIDLLSQA